MSTQRFTTPEVEITIRTFREGLLSSVGHDLELRLTRATAQRTAQGGLVATADTASIELVGALGADGQVDPKALSPRDRRKIEQSTVKDVLAAKKHPQALFRAPELRRTDDGGVEARGELTLHGRTRPLVLRAAPRGDRLVARLTLRQPDFGIKPFSAMLGALKVRAEVEIEISVPAAAASAIPEA